jgi:hypothetical protein
VKHNKLRVFAATRGFSGGGFELFGAVERQPRLVLFARLEQRLDSLGARHDSLGLAPQTISRNTFTGAQGK